MGHFVICCLDLSYLTGITILLVARAHHVAAAFTRAACRDGRCIQRNRAGTLCTYPSPDAPAIRECLNADLIRVLDRHINPSLTFYPTPPSTGYYDMPSLAFLGGADWSLSPSMLGHVAVCHTGLHPVKNKYYTTCRFALADDDFDSPFAVESCGLVHEHGRSVLQDKCCGLPRSVCPVEETGWMGDGSLSFWMWIGLAALVTVLLARSCASQARVRRRQRSFSLLDRQDFH